MNECINHQSAAQTNQAIKELNNDALKVFERGIRSIHEDLVLTATTTTTTRRTRRTTTTGSEQEVVPVPVLSSLGNRRHGDPPRRGMCVNRALELLLVALQMALQICENRGSGGNANGKKSTKNENEENTKKFFTTELDDNRNHDAESCTTRRTSPSTASASASASASPPTCSESKRRESLLIEKFSNKGMYTFLALPITIPPPPSPAKDETEKDGATEDHAVSCFHLLGATLCYNIGVCNMLLYSKQKSDSRDKEAQKYFNRSASWLLSHKNEDSSITLVRNDSTRTAPSTSSTDHTIIISTLPVQQMIHYMGVALLHNQGLLHYRSNDYKNAILCYEQARDKSISTYGDRHPLVAHAINGIAATLLTIQAGSSIAAETPSEDNHTKSPVVVVIGEGNPLNYLNKFLSILLNPLHRENMHATSAQSAHQEVQIAIATVRNTIGDIKFAQKEFETAYSFFENAYQIRNNALGVAHPDTAVSALNAGKCLHCLHKPDQALPYYDIFIKALLSFSPTNNYNILTEETVLHIQSIAWAFHQERSFNNSNKLYDLSLKTARKVLGDDNHKVVARILNQWGNLRFECGDMAFALQCYEKGLQIEHALDQKQQRMLNARAKSSTRNASYLDTLTSLSNIAIAHEHMGHLEQSLLYSTKMMTIFRSHDVMATISTSTINQVVTDVVVRIARVQGKLGRSDQALKSLTEALKFQRQEYGNDHMIIATTLNEIGIIHGNQGRTRLALQYFEESLRIRQLLNDPDQGIITTAMFNIAHIHIQQGDSAKAVLVLKELVEYELSKRNTLSFGSDNPSLSSPEVVLSALEQMAHVLQDDLQNPLEALNCLKKGIRIIMDSSGSSAPNVNVVRVPVDVHVHSRYLGMAGNICLKLGDMGGAIRFFADTMRVNLAGGLAFHANIRPKGYDMFFSFENTRPPAAPAA